MSERTHWSSNTAFVLAAIGSAIGLGNLWRFPYICYANGGGAFLVAYVVALFSVGIPVLLLEIGSGHRHKMGLPHLLRSIGTRYEWIGWAVIGVSFVITCYYAVIMSWCLRYLVDSFTLAWGSDPKKHFFESVLGFTSGPTVLGGIRPWLVVGLLVSWIAIVACIWKGPETVSKVVYATVLLPWALLIVFVIRGVTLEGAAAGLSKYLRPDWSMLLTAKVWLAAYTQVFFSLSIGFGVMFAYGSFIGGRTNINKYVFIIAIADAVTAFVAGLAVFAGVGYLSHVSQTPIAELKLRGPGLVFCVYPAIISKLPFLREGFGVMFFLMLLALAIDSAFSLVEAVATAVKDNFGWSKRKSNIATALVACAIGLVFTTGAGLHWLDMVDHFMNNGLAIACLVECILLGWMCELATLREAVNANSSFAVGKWWEVLIKYASPLLIGWFLANEIAARVRQPYAAADGHTTVTELLGGWLVLALIVVAAVLMSRRRHTEQG